MSPGQPHTRLTARTSWRDPRGSARRAVFCIALGIFVGAHGGGPSLEAGMEAIRTGVSLAGVDLRGADLRGADLREANLQEAQLQGARLQGARLQGADLQGANLERAQLQGVSLQGANLQEANLEEANLQGAFLWQANLQGAQLQGADLTGVIGLTLWQVETAVTDERTRLPDYVRPPPPAKSKVK